MTSDIFQRHLFLDLEDTIITPVVQGWPNVDLINIERIAQFIEAWRPTTLNIFSFALHSEWDMKMFKLDVAPRIERAFGMPLNLVPLTNEDIIRRCCLVRKLSPERVTFSDASDFWSKHEAFRLYVRSVFGSSNCPKPLHVALLDDAVEDEDFNFVSLGIAGSIRNIDRL